MDILRGYISSFCKKFHLHTSCYTQSNSAIRPSVVFLLAIQIVNNLIATKVISLAYLGNIVHYTSSLHNHFHHICCNEGQHMDILRGYISFFCKKFHLHTSCYTHSNSAIRPSVVFLLCYFLLTFVYLLMTVVVTWTTLFITFLFFICTALAGLVIGMWAF